MTSAVNESEDIIMGAIPGMPKVVAHTPVLAYENAEFMQAWYDAEAELDPSRVRSPRGSSQREDQRRRLLGGWGRPVRDGQPITTNEWIDRLGCPRCCAAARNPRDKGRRDPEDVHQPRGQGAWGARHALLERDLPRRAAHHQHPGMSGAAGQHDGVADAAGHGAGGRASRPCRSCWRVLLGSGALRPDRTSGCNRAAFYEHGNFATEYGSDHRCLVKPAARGRS